MLQVVLNYRNGDLKVMEVPCPASRPSRVLVRNVASAVSAGTEKLMIDMAKKSLIGKARARPDLVRQVINKARVDGVLEAYRAATTRLDAPVPLGYSCAGEIADVGAGADEFRVGDTVACVGSSYASHSEIVSVPRNLAVKIPDGVGFEEAAFAGVGAIALHAVRTADAKLGDNVAVIGLGLLGLIAVQMLRSAGCRVFGVDLDPSKVSLALELGATDAIVAGDNGVAKALDFSRGYGADLVLVFAGGEGNEAVELGAEIVRERGRLVVPGMVGLDLPRRLFYEKQIQFEVSRSAGPGMSDPLFEQKGVDYPLPYVRWTARRNVEQFLTLVASGSVRLGPIITHRFDIRDADKAYNIISDGSARQIGVVLTYPNSNAAAKRIELKSADKRQAEPLGTIGVGMIGAGLFANTTLSPILKGISGLSLRGIATASGTTAQHTGEKYGYAYCTSDYREILSDPDINCVLIATRHNLHAQMAAEALEKGKHVFLEKPLATDVDQLRHIVRTYYSAGAMGDASGGNGTGPRLMVGFNRRFSPFSVKAADLLDGRATPVVAHIRVNAGSVPRDSWVNDPEEGAGRVIGEVCHFVDLAQFFAGSSPVRVYAEPMGERDTGSTAHEDLAITLAFKDGSVASILYVSHGDRAFPRERVELFWDESVCVIDNFRAMQFTRKGKRSNMKRWNVDRGHRGELRAFFDSLKRGNPPPVPFNDYVYTTLTTFAILESIRQGRPVEVDPGQLDLAEQPI